MKHWRLLSVDNGEKSLPCPAGRRDYYANFIYAIVIGGAGTRGEVGII
jgi:hypothetical protein